MKEKEFLPLVQSALGIETLNRMQRDMIDVVPQGRDIVLLSPTGSGKTLAFILPILKLLKAPTGRIQAIIIAPSRELVLQIGSIVHSIAKGIKCVELYGGHKVEDEVNSLRDTPDIIVGTPGRLLDHLNRGNIDLWPVRICVLDEFDKILELGFEHELKRLMAALKNLSRRILTSATAPESYPEYIKLQEPQILNFLDNNTELDTRLDIMRVNSDSADKLETLYLLLQNIAADYGLGKTIVFVNHRESANRVYDYLKSKGVSTVLYHGALDQTEREKAIALYRSGAANVLVSTDLGARGLDIEGVKNVIHYHLPLTEQAYTHRNGRTARVKANGRVFLLISDKEEPEAFIATDKLYSLKEIEPLPCLNTGLSTLHIAAGKREKISKGDILGWLTKDMNVEPSKVGRIEVGDHYALVSLPASIAKEISNTARAFKIKGSKRPVHLIG